jgi:hypothetical protein
MISTDSIVVKPIYAAWASPLLCDTCRNPRFAALLHVAISEEICALLLSLSMHHCARFWTLWNGTNGHCSSEREVGSKRDPTGFSHWRRRQMASDIRTLVEEFVNQIVAAVEADSVHRVQQAVAAAFGAGAVPSRRPGRAALSAFGPAKRRPKQLCPVPGCTGVAAPVFGMVCAKHKDVPKAKIKEYRVARRAAKGGR